MGEIIKLTASDGHILSAYKAVPDGTPKGGVVVIQEIFGVNEHIRDVADGFATEGYLAIAPALFDRAERGVELGYGPDDREKGMVTRGLVDWDDTVKDTIAAKKAVASAGKVGIVGYCYGGTVAWLGACKGGLMQLPAITAAAFTKISISMRAAQLNFISAQKTRAFRLKMLI